jgi:hypothetical protein
MRRTKCLVQAWIAATLFLSLGISVPGLVTARSQEPIELYVSQSVMESTESIRVADNSANPVAQSTRRNQATDERNVPDDLTMPPIAESGTVPIQRATQMPASSSASQVGAAPYLQPNAVLAHGGNHPIPTNFEGNQVSKHRTASPVKPVTIQKPAPSIGTYIEVPSYINLNQPAQLRIKLHNSGEVAASNVRLLATIPDHVRFAGSNPAPSNHQGRVYEFQVSEIGGRQAREIIIDLIPTEKKAIDIGTEVIVENIQRFSVSVREPRIKLSLQGPTEANLGQNVVHRVLLENTGDGLAENVELHAVFPAQLRCEKNNRLAIPALEPGQKLEIQMPALATSAGKAEFAVSVAAVGVEPQSVKTDLQIYQPELEVSASGPKINFLNREGIYSIVLDNVGQMEATKVTVDFQVPAGMKVTTISHPAKVDPQTGRLTWDLDRIEAKSVQTIKLLTIATQQGQQDCVFTVKSQQTTDKTIHLATNVVTRPELTIKLQNQSGPVQVGGKVQFLIVVENAGSSSAENIAIKVELPEALSADQQDEMDVLGMGNNIAFEASKLEPGQKREFRFVAVANEPGEHVVRTLLTTSASERQLVSEGAVFVYELNENRISEALSPAIIR